MDTVWWHFWLTVASLTTTYAAVPGLCSSLESSFQLLQRDEWFSVLLVCEFTLANFLGSFGPAVPGGLSRPRARLWTLVSLPVRASGVGLLAVLANARARWPLDWVPHLLLSTLGLSSGYLVAQAAEGATEVVEEKDRKRAGELLSLAFSVGIAAGTSLAFLGEKLGAVPA